MQGKALHLIGNSGLIGVAAIIISIGSVLAPVGGEILWNVGKERASAILPLAFFGYLIAQFAVTEIGFFPVPVLGAGASPVIGWYLMAGLILARHLNDSKFGRTKVTEAQWTAN